MALNHRQSNDDKEISHLANGHGVRAVAHDAEDTKKSDTDTDARLGLQVLKHEEHEEH